ncbi:MAG: hypothetical protein ACNA7Z_05805, partial [Dethiobacteria bacterium]
MPIDKKKTIPLVFFTLFFLIMISAPVSAAISGFVARDSSGDYYEYAYEDLIDSYALKIIGSPNGLYDDFAAKETVALLSSSGAYLDYKDV